MLVHVAFLFLIFRVLEPPIVEQKGILCYSCYACFRSRRHRMVRCGGKPEKLVDLYFDEVDDVEVDESWRSSAVDAKPAAMPLAPVVAA